MKEPAVIYTSIFALAAFVVGYSIVTDSCVHHEPPPPPEHVVEHVDEHDVVLDAGIMWSTETTSSNVIYLVYPPGPVWRGNEYSDDYLRRAPVPHTTARTGDTPSPPKVSMPAAPLSGWSFEAAASPPPKAPLMPSAVRPSTPSVKPATSTVRAPSGAPVGFRSVSVGGRR